MDSGGNIHHFMSEEELNDWEKEQQKLNQPFIRVFRDDLLKVKRMNKERRKGWMRNQPCICGSNKKFKKCCWDKFDKQPKNQASDL